jgi:acyl-CoA dehydrogenase
MNPHILPSYSLLSPHAQEIYQKVSTFMSEVYFPQEALYFKSIQTDPWTSPHIMDEWKAQAKEQGLWNLFLPDAEWGGGLTHFEYAHLAELMGHSLIASEIFNCSAPDTGNMEVLWKYGSKEQKEQWLVPLSQGKIRSAFAMTEPEVASSDATNMQAMLTPVEGGYRLNAHKWWTTGGGDQRCRILIVMARNATEGPRHQQHSMVLVPMDAVGVDLIRPLTVFGYDDAPHGHVEMKFTDVFVPQKDLLLGEGRGFEIAQGRLGPGRIHHCMRLIGLAERALSALCQRADERIAFGKALSDQGVIRAHIAQSRLEINQARLLTHQAAQLIDQLGNQAARHVVGMIKIIAPTMAQNVIDRAIQVHGGMGLSQDTFLAHAYAWARVLRLADGPDEVHQASLARYELKKQRQFRSSSSEL